MGLVVDEHEDAHQEDRLTARGQRGLKLDRPPVGQDTGLGRQNSEREGRLGIRETQPDAVDGDRPTVGDVDLPDRDLAIRNLRIINRRQARVGIRLGRVPNFRA